MRGSRNLRSALLITYMKTSANLKYIGVLVSGVARCHEVPATYEISVTLIMGVTQAANIKADE